MKMPLCKAGRDPQIGQSLAESATSAERGRKSSGPCRWPPISKRYVPPQIAIQLSMIVVITSWAPDGRLQRAGDPAPERPSQDACGDREQDVERPRHPFEVGSDPECRDEADPVLALPADVEEPAAERERDRDPGEHERRHDDERLLQVVGGVLARFPRDPGEEPVEAGAFEDGFVGGDRVAAGDQHDEPADQERKEGGDERDDDAAEPGREPLGHGSGGRRRSWLVRHQAASSRRPPVMAKPSSSSETVGGYSPTIRPS